MKVDTAFNQDRIYRHIGCGQARIRTRFLMPLPTYSLGCYVLLIRHDHLYKPRFLFLTDICAIQHTCQNTPDSAPKGSWVHQLPEFASLYHHSTAPTPFAKSSSLGLKPQDPIQVLQPDRLGQKQVNTASKGLLLYAGRRQARQCDDGCGLEF
jgi:hypothetical protein